MRTFSSRWAAAASMLAVGLTACTAVDAGAPRDKAGGTSPTVTLTIGTTDPRGRPDTGTVEHFVERVRTLTSGAVTIEVMWNAGGEFNEPEQAIVKQVQSGRLDLGWVGSRVFDTMGVTSLQAIQAPFLVTTNEATARVAADPVAERMLSGLSAVGLVGLGLYPDQLRHPVGFRRPLASMADFRGARIRTPNSNVSDTLLRSLGAEPVHLNANAYDKAVSDGSLDGVEASIGLAPALHGAVVTGNVVFFPRMTVLVTSDGALAKLDRSQRATVDRAAEETLSVATEALSDAEDASRFCAGGGTVVTASASEVQAMREAAREVYAELEADVETKANIEAIRAIVAEIDPGRAPTTCGQPSVEPEAADALLPDGTYTATGTKAEALRLGAGDECALKGDGAHFRLELVNGEFTLWRKCNVVADDILFQGTFTVTPETLTFIEACCGEVYADWSWDGRLLTLASSGVQSGEPLDPVGRFVMDRHWEKAG